MLKFSLKRMQVGTNSSRKSGIIFAVFAILCGLAAAGLVVTAGMMAAPSVPVLQVTDDLVPGDFIEGHVTMVKMPKAGLPADVITSIDEIKNAVTKHGLSAGDILRRSHLIKNADSGGLLSARLVALNNPQLRAVEVPVESVAGMLGGMKAGDKVDIIAVYQTGINNHELSSQTIIFNAPVIGVKTGGEEDKAALVIAVNQQEAEKLALYREKGKVYVALKPLNAAKDGSITQQND